MTVILDGARTAQGIKDRIRKKARDEGLRPLLSAVLAGKDDASRMYVRMKEKACKDAGFRSRIHTLSEKATESELMGLISSLNQDPEVDGVLVQLPLPKGMDTQKILSCIDPSKDIDGFHPQSLGEVATGFERMVAATPKGVIELLNAYDIPLEGRHAVIVNHSTVVGKPLSMLFLNRNATVTVCHVKTRDLRSHTLCADILVSATGVPHLIVEDMVPNDCVVVDVGIAYKAGKTVGDVDFENVKSKCSHISPVPGGSGPMTIACLLENALECAKRRK